MSNQPTPPPPRNPETKARHRQETFWQITVPVIIGSTVLFALIVLVVLSDSGYVSRWGDIALIWVLPCPMAIALLIAGIFGGMAYGMWKLLRWLPPFAFTVQNFFVLVQMKAKGFADGLVEPMLRLRAFFAGADALKQELTRKETASKGNEP